MDIFDQYLFEELVSEYERPNLTDDDYEELYVRFCNLNHLEEVKPYLLVMRYLGLGTTADSETALNELKEIMDNNVELTGLYNDLKLCTNLKNTEAIVELRRSIEDGYCGKYLKDRSNITSIEKAPKQNNKPSAPMTKNTVIDDKIHYKGMIFEGCGYSGFYFTSGDIDYLHAKIFIEPMKATRKITIRSQIYDGDEPFSKVFWNERTLKPGDTWFTTIGWGNKNYNAFDNRVYQWQIEIDGAVYSEYFEFYTGKIDKCNMPIKDVKLFASKASGALETDRDRYAVSFDSATLEYIYFKCFINRPSEYKIIDVPGEYKIFEIWIKVTCLEDNTVFYDGCNLQILYYDSYAFWTGIGFSTKGSWKKGLYKYTIRISSGSTQEGIFTIY